MHVSPKVESYWEWMLKSNKLQGCQMMSSRNEISLVNGKKLLVVEYKKITLKIPSMKNKLYVQMEHYKRVGAKGTCRKLFEGQFTNEKIICNNVCTFTWFLSCFLLATIFIRSLGMPLPSSLSIVIMSLSTTLNHCFGRGSFTIGFPKRNV